jgi:hypothetical protein
MKKILLAGAFAGSLLLFNSAHAQNQDSALRADSHAPIGVMGDHRHKKGEWMVSYRAMHMSMDGNRDGTNNLSNNEVIATPNRFGAPANLRVVPENMSTDMHMVGAMVAPSDDVTLMAMGMYLDRDMDHSTYNMVGAKIGEFTTRTKGFGDTKLSALIGIHEDAIHKVHFNAGLSLPTGSITKRGDVLTPMGTTVNLRLPYAMQLGSGTYDLTPAVTYNGHKDKMGWGAQYQATLRMGRNSEDYSLGNKHQITGWGSYALNPAISISARLTAEAEGKIDGIDSNIAAPVQTADPNNYGGERVATSIGLNAVVPNGKLKGHRFSLEGTVPVYQNLNGPQLKRDFGITAGWSKAF